MGVGFVELTRVGAVDFQHAKESLAVAATLDQHVDRAPDAVIRQQLRCPEPGFFLQMV
jgi:hypothetical protein